MFIGREQQLKWLNHGFLDRRSHLTIIYGRRRIGKTALIEHYSKGKPVFHYIALKTGRKKQIRNFLVDLSKFLGDPLVASAPFSLWREVFELMIPRMPPKKIILVLDEFQWMCQGDPSLLSVIQMLWDRHWQRDNKTHLILCGSSTSFMLDEVLSQKSPLFGRRTQTIELGPLSPSEAKRLLKVRDNREAALYLMSFGAIPAYLLLVDHRLSFEQNMNNLAFCANAYFTNELQYILSDQLKQPATYSKILSHLSLKNLSARELGQATHISSGPLFYYLDRLKTLRIVEEYRPILLPDNAKTVQFKINDEYVRFYFAFIKPNLQVIAKNGDGFLFDRLTSKKWETYCGIAFERFCFKNADQIIIDKLGIGSVFTQYGPYWHKKSTKRPHGVQIDMVIERRDRISAIVECKWSKEKIGYGVFKELEQKCALYPNPKRHRLKNVLIASSGVTENLIAHPEVDVITLGDFFNTTPPTHPYTSHS